MNTFTIGKADCQIVLCKILNSSSPKVVRRVMSVHNDLNLGLKEIEKIENVSLRLRLLMIFYQDVVTKFKCESS